MAKSRAGRPRLNAEMATLTTYVPAELASWVRGQADSDGRTVASWLRRTLEGVRKQKGD